MTLTAATTRNDYTATSGQTVFPYTFTALSDTDIKVVKNGVTLTLGGGNDYTVSGIGSYGGNVTLNVGATTGDTLSVYLDMPIDRTTNYQNSGDFLAADVNGDVNKSYIALQQMATSILATIRKPTIDSNNINMELPSSATRAGQVLGFDGNGAVKLYESHGASASVRPEAFGAVGANNIVRYTANGSTNVFDVGFTYIGSLVVVRVNNVHQTQGTDYTLINGGTQVQLTSTPSNGDLVNVAPDDTHAFNLALKAAEDYNTYVKNIYEVELDCGGGWYNVTGIVYVRKGQTISGGGALIYMGGTGSFKLGWQEGGNQDPGGHPVFVKDLFIQGGYRPIDSWISGYTVHNVFFSFSSFAPDFGGTDGLVQSCTFDGGSRLAKFSGRSCVYVGNVFYEGNEQIKISCNDSIIANNTFNYPKITSILWEGAGQTGYIGYTLNRVSGGGSAADEAKIEDLSHVLNTKIVGNSFAKNAQNDSTFLGYVKVSNSSFGSSIGDLEVSGNSFRNGYGAAIKDSATSINHSMVIKNNTFDGVKTNYTYTQSTTMYAIDISESGKFEINDNIYRNLLAVPIQIDSDTIYEINVKGGKFRSNVGTHEISVAGTSYDAGNTTFSIGGCNGDKKNLLNWTSNARFEVTGRLHNWLTIQNDGTYDYVVAPFDGAGLLKATLVANPDVGTSDKLRTIKSISVSNSYDYNGSAMESRITKTDDFASASPTQSYNLAFNAAYDTPTGGTIIASIDSPSKICLYWPQTYTNETVDVQYTAASFISDHSG
jgi:hypothetical protein